MGDQRTTTGESPPLPRKRRLRKLRMQAWFALGLAAAVAAACVMIDVNRYVPASGYITAESYAEVQPGVQGIVSEILVPSGTEVARGDVLVQLNDREERAELDEAASIVRKIEAELVRQQAESGEEKRQGLAHITTAKLRLAHASAKLQLTAELREKGLASANALEDTNLNEKLASAQLDALLAADQSLAGKRIAVLREELAARRKTVARADAHLAARQVRAPISGRTLRYEFVPGELVQPGTVLYEIFGGDKQIMKLRIMERHATLVRPGQPYRTLLVPYTGTRRIWFVGEIERLRDVIQSEKDRTYRVAYCSFDAGALAVPHGTTAEARIHVGKSPLWKCLFGLY